VCDLFLLLHLIHASRFTPIHTYSQLLLTGGRGRVRAQPHRAADQRVIPRHSPLRGPVQHVARGQAPGEQIYSYAYTGIYIDLGSVKIYLHILTVHFEVRGVCDTAVECTAGEA